MGVRQPYHLSGFFFVTVPSKGLNVVLSDNTPLGLRGASFLKGTDMPRDCICSYCGNTFTRAHITRRFRHDFCNRTCQTAYMRQESLGDVTREELVKLYWEDELSLSAIATRFGKSTMTVHRWFKQLDIPRHSLRQGSKLATTTPEFAEAKRQQTAQMWEDGVFGSEEYRQKISDTKTGQPRPDVSEANKQRWADGTFGSDEWRRKQSDSHHGAKCYRWRGGSVNYRGPNWQQQRRKARKRDNYTCQDCGVTEASLGQELNVHHLRPYHEFDDNWKEANKLDNLISLCLPCHIRAEHNYESSTTP